MRFFQLFVFFGLVASGSFAATVKTTNSTTRTDGTTASCRATFTRGHGGDFSRCWSYGPGAFKWYGMITRTPTSAGSSACSKAVVRFANEFQAQNSKGHGVVIMYDVKGGIQADLVPVEVYVKDALREYQLVATLYGGDDYYTVSYQGCPIDILLQASNEGGETSNPSGLFHLDLLAY